MKKIKVLIRSSRFLIPATIVLNENGAVDVFLNTSVSESTKVRGSLSPREISSVIPNRAEFSPRERKCKFSVRKIKRKMEVLDRNEGKLLKYLGIDSHEAMKEDRRFYSEIYLVKIESSSWDYTFIVDRRSAAILENYFTKYCTLVETS